MAPSMKLTPLQVRTVLDISEETLRYWKQKYPQLKGRRGYGPCFTFGEVLVLHITKVMVENLAVDIKRIEPLATQLFRLCNSSVSLLRDADGKVVIDLQTMKITMLNAAAVNPADSHFCMVISLSQIAHEIRSRVLQCLGEDEDPQMTLTLGPTALAPEPTKQKIKS